MTTDNTKRLFTVPETMAALRVGRTKLYELINSGALQVVRFGKRSTRIRAESVEHLLNYGTSV